MRIAGEIILKSLGAWVAIWGFSRLLNAPKKLECYTAGVGMIGWAVYLIVEVFNDGILMKNFLAAVAVALVSQAMARHFKAPVILFVIPGILPMVPTLFKTAWLSPHKTSLNTCIAITFS